MVHEANKSVAEECKNKAVSYMKRGDIDQAIKWFRKSEKLYPLPGVKAMMEKCMSSSNGGSSHSSSSSSTPTPSARPSSSSTASSHGEDMRSATPKNITDVQDILSAKKKSHYDVLGIPRTATSAEIKKAYRKKSVLCHPDKNPYKDASDAFKAVAVAYQVLGDEEEKAIYDESGGRGTEDPDSGPSGGGGYRPRHQGDVSPEDIFNMFFNGGMGGMGGMGGRGFGGGPGFRVYSNGFGGGFGGGQPFGGGFGGHHRHQRHNDDDRDRDPNQRRQQNPLNFLLQFLPLLFMLLTFTSFGEDAASGGSHPGSTYFSLTPKHPFIRELKTTTSGVKDIPYFVQDKFLRSINRDPYQLRQVEGMVEKSYEIFLQNKCKEEKSTKRKMLSRAEKIRTSEEDRNREVKKAREARMVRCEEHRSLFGSRQQYRR